ncbi:MAG TPA: GNAT family N-acetyltransferase [Myxococcota bacterium]|nr:GNAT family N-acetyltransferase [Myxococcota bacterium]
MQFSLVFEPNLSSADENTIYQGLLAHNAEDLGLPLDEIRTKPFAFVVRIDGAIKAGLVGNIKYRSAFVDTLWVDKSLRKQGVGRKLLAQAEEHAAKNSCNVIFLNTLSPANVSFYKKSGYVFEFERKDYLGGYPMRYFRKPLG